MVRSLVLAAVALGFAAALPTAEAGKKPAKKGLDKDALFAKADTNNDGTISKAEFEKFLAEAKAKAKKAKAK